jgi:hypothetical protein
VQPKHAAAVTFPSHALYRPPVSRRQRRRPHRAAPDASGRRAALSSLVVRAFLRSVTVAVVAVVAGGMVYVVLPVPSAAAPGLPATASAALVAAEPVLMPPPPTPGLLGGLIGDDLVDDPAGITSSAPDAGVDGLIGWPVTDHTPSTGFGYRSDPFTHRQRWHDGVDLGQPCGDAVRAALGGTVAFTGWAGGYGNRIIVRHADRGGRSFATTYNHLSRIDVAVGEVVQQGAAIARIGSTGRSTACHLHFEVILDGSYVDPMRFLTGDQSKAGLSRRVGSYMPSGMPSPVVATRTPTPTSTSPSPTASPTHRSTPTPTPTTPSPSPSDTSPSPTPSDATPAVSGTPSPSAGTPSPNTASPNTPSPNTPSPATVGASQSVGTGSTVPTPSPTPAVTPASIPVSPSP